MRTVLVSVSIILIPFRDTVKLDGDVDDGDGQADVDNDDDEFPPPSVTLSNQPSSGSDSVFWPGLS